MILIIMNILLDYFLKYPINVNSIIIDTFIAAAIFIVCNFFYLLFHVIFMKKPYSLHGTWKEHPKLIDKR
jgi:hypothetical protein